MVSIKKVKKSSNKCKKFQRRRTFRRRTAQKLIKKEVIKETNVLFTRSESFEISSAESTPKIQSEEEARKYYDDGNSKAMLIYAESILKNFIEKSKKQKISPDFISKHNIPSEDRKKIIDWLYYITTFYNLEIRNFFSSVFILDTYFNTIEPTNFTRPELELLAVTSIYIFSKIIEVKPLTAFKIWIDIDVDKKVITPLNIKEKELEILNALEFDIMGVTTYDFISLLFANLQNSINKDYLEKVKIFETLSYFIAESLLLKEDYYKSDVLSNSIACILVALELFNKKFGDNDSLFENWIFSIIAQFNLDFTNIQKIKNKMSKYINTFINDEMNLHILQKNINLIN